MPRVSVIMPSFDQEWIVRRAVESIAWQSFEDHELIVVDDGGGLNRKPGLVVSLRETYGPGMKYIRRGAPGGSAAKPVNTGFQMADTGSEYVTWVSSDNIMHPEWLSRLVTILDAGAGAAYGGFTAVYATREQMETAARDTEMPLDMVRQLWEHQRMRYLFEPYAPEKQIKREACYFGPAFLIRRDVWQSHRGMSAHDLDNWLRVEEACWDRGLPIVGLNESCCWYLSHDERCVVRHPEKYDAPVHLATARERRREKYGALVPEEVVM